MIPYSDNEDPGGGDPPGELIYGEINPDNPLLDEVEAVLHSPDPEDGLVGRFDDTGQPGTYDDPRLADWRTMSPDDSKGSLIQARIPDAIRKKMDHLISRTRGEVWANPSDFIREAIWQYIKWVLNDLGINDPTLVSLLTEAELGGRAQFHATRRGRLENAINDTRSYLTDLLNLDDHEEAHRFMLELALRMRSIHVTSWRRQWLLALNALPIMRVTARLLDRSGWDIPQEFYPAAGKALIPPGGGHPSGGNGNTLAAPASPGLARGSDDGAGPANPDNGTD